MGAAVSECCSERGGERDHVGSRPSSPRSAAFVPDNTGSIADSYFFDKRRLGRGSFAWVCRGKCKATEALHAIKIIPKEQSHIRLDRCKSEVAILKRMDHPNIVGLKETFQDECNIFLVMELCQGGELVDEILEVQIPEKHAAGAMRQVLQGVHYMHEKRVCHRDLKPNSILLTSRGAIEQTTLKICGFHLACRWEQGQVLRSKTGTPYYMAPQVLAGGYDHKCDLWSIGVVMYMVLCGYPPFWGDSDMEVLAKVRLGFFAFPGDEWKDISEDAKSLISGLLEMNPACRPTAAQALDHAWMKRSCPCELAGHKDSCYCPAAEQSPRPLASER